MSQSDRLPLPSAVRGQERGRGDTERSEHRRPGCKGSCCPCLCFLFFFWEGFMSSSVGSFRMRDSLTANWKTCKRNPQDLSHLWGQVTRQVTGQVLGSLRVWDCKQLTGLLFSPRETGVAGVGVTGSEVYLDSGSRVTKHSTAVHRHWLSSTILQAQ